jgi:hypothetical protein
VKTESDTGIVDGAQAASNNSMDQIADILDDADLSSHVDLTTLVVSCLLPLHQRSPTQCSSGQCELGTRPEGKASQRLVCTFPSGAQVLSFENAPLFVSI